MPDTSLIDRASSQRGLQLARKLPAIGERARRLRAFRYPRRRRQTRHHRALPAASGLQRRRLTQPRVPAARMPLSAQRAATDSVAA